MKHFVMTTAEMKKTIVEKIETLSESQLNELQLFIDRINKLPVKEYKLMEHVESIVTEREEVLKKLAK